MSVDSHLHLFDSIHVKNWLDMYIVKVWYANAEHVIEIRNRANVCRCLLNYKCPVCRVLVANVTSLVENVARAFGAVSDSAF